MCIYNIHIYIYICTDTCAYIYINKKNLNKISLMFVKGYIYHHCIVNFVSYFENLNKHEILFMKIKKFISGDFPDEY